MTDLPSGTVTFLFTDIEGSTPLLETLGPERYRAVVQEHGEILRRAIAEAGGIDLSTAGDSFFAVFESAAAAVSASVSAQTALAAHLWPEKTPVRVRMGLHTGEGVPGGDNYIGIDVNIAARIEAAGHGGQVLISGATASLVQRSLPERVSISDLGKHHLKGISEPEQIFQLVIPGLPEEFPPIATLDAQRTNLPTQLTNFIGRENELHQIQHLLEDTRLLTLTGPGGTGKTRLALQVAAMLTSDYSDGVWFIPLGSVTDAALFMSAVASTLSLSDTGSAPISDLVTQYLAGRSAVLVLDNFEQIVEAAPQVAGLLAAAPQVKALVTSREPLHVSGEQEFQVPPLALPDPKNLPPLEALSHYDAVALFVQRARSVDADFNVTNKNAPAVAEIAARLDGLPLAIELAAARIRLLSPDAMLARMQDRLSLLQSGTRDVPQRQKTLRDAIAWSYDLLDPDEKGLLRQFGIFTGGFTLETAEAVVGEGIDLFEDISSLLDKSLIRQDLDDKDEGRFSMLETIREYALEQLDAEGDRSEAGRRHAEFFARKAEEAEPRLEGGPEWLDRLEHEHRNLLGAISFFAEEGDVEAAMFMSGRLWRFWHLRGHLTEGRQILEHILDLPSAQLPTDARAKALVGVGGLVYWQADYTEAERLYHEALSIYKDLEDLANQAWVLYSISSTYGMRSDPDAALPFSLEAVDLFRRAGDRHGLAVAESDVAWIKANAGDLDGGREAFEESLRLIREFDDKYNEATIIFGLANLESRAGNLDRAFELCFEAQDLFRALGDMTGVGLSLLALGNVALEAGDCERGLRLVGGAEKLREEFGGAPPSTIDMEDPRQACRDSLTPEEVRRAWEAGRAMSLEDLLAYARQKG
jgi:predicted ATPase/class 3 adenylate cyclase